MGLNYSRPQSFNRNRMITAKEGADLIDVARQAIARDCVKTFVGAIREQQESEFSHYGKVYFSECPFEFISLIFKHGAAKCANALLKCETRFNCNTDSIMDRVNVPWIDGLPPLHLAARDLSYGLTEVFLLHGADPNRSSHGRDANIPLCLALEALRCHPCVAEWDVKKSPFKLIYILCLKELREAMDTVKLLASRTQNLHKISLQYAEEGEVVELTALLLVAWDKLVAPFASIKGSSSYGAELSPIGQCIYKELELLCDQQLNGQHLINQQQLSLRSSKLGCAWKMLNIFDRCHFKIDNYLYHTRNADLQNFDVPLNVYFIISDDVPEFEPDEDLYCDDVPCLAPFLKPQEADELRRKLELQMRSGPPALPAAAVVENYVSKVRGAAISHSFHTWSKPEFAKDLKKAHKLPPFHPLLPNVKMCSILFSTVKRCIK